MNPTNDPELERARRENETGRMEAHRKGVVAGGYYWVRVLAVWQAAKSGGWDVPGSDEQASPGEVLEVISEVSPPSGGSATPTGRPVREIEITGCYFPFASATIGPGPSFVMRDQLVMPMDKAVERGFVQITSAGYELAERIDSRTGRPFSENLDELAKHATGARERHLYDAADRSRYCKWCNEEEYHPVHIAARMADDQPWIVGVEKEAAAAVDPTQESVNRRVEHDLAVIAARMVIKDPEQAHRRLFIGDVVRMAKVVLAHAGGGPVAPPAAELVYTAPAPKSEASPDLQTAIGEMDSGLNALVNELAPDVVQNLRTRFEDVLRHTNNQLLKPSHELEALRSFHEHVTTRARDIDGFGDVAAILATRRLCRDVLANNGQALMKPHQLDAFCVTVSGTNPSGANLPNAGMFVETPGLLNTAPVVTKREDGACTVGPPPDGRPVAEHLAELANGPAVKRVIDIARRVVSRGMHLRVVGSEFLHNDIEGMRMLAEAVAALDKEKP